MLGEPKFDITPPAPIAYPKFYNYELDESRHSKQELTPIFLSNCKPLLVGTDLGMPIE